MELLYDGKRDGFSQQAFHTRCDNHTNTLMLARSNHNRRCGGYTSLPWDSTTTWKSNDPYAFNFSIEAGQMYTIHDQAHVIYCHATYGPTFGYFGLQIFQNNTLNCLGNLGYSYGQAQEMEYNTPKANTTLAGSQNFSVTDIEVYQLTLVE